MSSPVELFVPFREFSWFANATVAKILNVQRPQVDHLFWPDLDVDLSVESIEHPERFPSCLASAPNTSLQRPRAAVSPNSAPGATRSTHAAKRAPLSSQMLGGPRWE